MGKILIALIVVVIVVAGMTDDDSAPPTSSSSNSPDTAPATPQAPPEPISPWHVSEWTSEMDDSPAVSLTTLSEGIYSGAYGGRSGRAELILRCLENTTNMYITLNGHYLADLQNYGRVTYRIDDQRARTVRMRESTDNKALGLWAGGQAIPVIRRFLGQDQVVMRVTPFNQSATTVTFPIEGIEEKIKPLRTACHW